MNRTRAVVAAIVVVGLLAAGVGALYTGVGPAPGDDSGGSIEDFPTATPSGGGGAAETSEPFAFTVDDIEECGSTCRDVTVTLSNEQDESATGVTVYTRIYAGQDSTAEEDLLWEGQEAVGTLGPDESTTQTERVELSFSEALAVQQNDGWITVLTTVETDEQTVTFTDNRQVA